MGKLEKELFRKKQGREKERGRWETRIKGHHRRRDGKTGGGEFRSGEG